MKKVIIIDPSIATIVDIDPVGFSEETPIYFTLDGDDDYVGVWQWTVFNSAKKNSKQVIDALTIVGNKMTLLIKPTADSIAVGEQYHEISRTDIKRVLYKGRLNIVK
jgi:hypothetical protein